ncbi:Ferredoxin subunit of nitrite reductase or a ring-hydroxylating dioxygenase [Halorientalis persicus]|jgi:nitrite reductase/ring-hydroxylating ferredoxin subunit|uniref:Ferredoxin subunit of nitrite reductase or a ring-hydroxylating dioxygenase n=1 Tax=Halorientalis persicus TaxID=1367881 RepID=A0A1H8EPH5_9EURY|nr:Rieske 2Fe-2S domain-containing protein [Halorientalis persicus]SEN21383.1 Ferredoxin subunit of nitrite reductase or a ring-hydroxylating dioxygenase [Halorientalis persicus]
MDEDSRIAAVDDVPTDSTFLFRVRDRETDEQKEAIIVRVTEGGDGEGDPGELACWLNYCQHFTHIKLDKGSGAPMRDGEVVCANHGAYFETESGLCTYGPCEGAYLQAVEIGIADGAVYLTDEDYAFVGVGPGEQDELDLSSKSNYEF